MKYQEINPISVELLGEMKTHISLLIETKKYT